MLKNKKFAISCAYEVTKKNSKLKIKKYKNIYVQKFLILHKKKIYIKKYPAIINSLDFNNFKNIIDGDLPKDNKNIFFGHSKMGFRGLSVNKKFIYAATYNSIYKINKNNYKLERIISNNMMSDLHGIYCEKYLWCVNPGIDTLIQSNEEGKIINTYKITKDLKIIVNDKEDRKIDWRFHLKQYAGPTGFYHINFVRKESHNIYLTSRNLGAVIKLNLKNNKAGLEQFGHNWPCMIHDGKLYKNKIYFTSIDGKVLIHNKNRLLISKRNEALIKKNKIRTNIYHKANHLIRLDLNLVKKIGNINWCRGISIIDDSTFAVCLDGRYGTKFFRIVFFKKIKNGKIKIIDSFKIYKNEISKTHLRFCTGFDIEQIS